MTNHSTEFSDVFSEFPFEHANIKHPVMKGGNGPSIILMHELDGFGPAFIELALMLSNQFTVYAPVFFDRIGHTSGLKAFFCIRKEFEVFRLGKSSRITDWIRGLVDHIAKQSNNSSAIGIVGMCMTGGIVLATISHPFICAGVAAQPSLPLAKYGTKRRKRDLGMEPQEIAEAAASGTPVLTLRYGNDTICPALRMPSILNQIPSAIRSPDYLENISSHPTLTDKYRSKSRDDIRDVSERAIVETIKFLKEHLSN